MSEKTERLAELLNFIHDNSTPHINKRHEVAEAWALVPVLLIEACGANEDVSELLEALT